MVVGVTVKASVGRVLIGDLGFAQELTFGELDTPDQAGTVASWFLDCPGQSPAWQHYNLSIIHLRDIEGVKSAIVTVPHATHEVMLFALDPARNPVPTDTSSWSFLRPVNVCEQIQLPDDGAASELLYDCARAVVNGILPAEPPLAGAVEPWRTALIKTAAHQRGEEHAP